ncbi:uncharacterized protein LOC115738094 isoform X2 [Rhodamnia argentea]|uniref:Uncharacterized protein LOC115738094 isoform X2 n=1 Tax=Rhodamnia argentea TaxID=178133 RepID=A0A8B8NVA7_9MYRT|nr:uncharacterized protein LOC115738094 isoform X2 [Rhodamnia argentea]
MQRSQALSGRKALKELPNNCNNGYAVNDFAKSARAKCSSKPSANPSKKSLPPSAPMGIDNHKFEDGVREEDEGDEGDSLDRLLLVQSDLSSVVHRVDELVAQAFKLQEMSKQGKKEVESLALFLSEMLSSLKPWPSRLQKAFSSPPIEPTDAVEPSPAVLASPVQDDESIVIESPEQAKMDSLISPSPLVSWRADCTVERGRQVFMLTPLPISRALSSTCQESSRSLLEKITSATAPPPSLALPQEIKDDSLKDVAIHPTPNKPFDTLVRRKDSTEELGFVSPVVLSKRDCSLLMMTPCFKVSPPKSCSLLEPISESSHWGNANVRKSTPYPVGLNNYSLSELSESSGDGASDGLAMRYPELQGTRQDIKLGIGLEKKASSPDWCISPPKSCILMEPPDEKQLTIATTNGQFTKTIPLLAQQADSLLSQGNAVLESHRAIEKSRKQEPVGSTMALIENTPVWKEPESIQMGKRPGENTLKRELWTKFEAASSCGFRVNSSTLLETEGKGFIDRLDEVSLGGGSPALGASS